jgi:hypothetical protein
MRTNSQCRLDHAGRRVAVAVQDAVGQRAVAGADASIVSRCRSAASRAAAQACLCEQVGEGLEVAERDGRQGLGDDGQEALGIGAVSALGVPAAAVQPEVDQAGVGIGCLDGQRGKPRYATF